MKFNYQFSHQISVGPLMLTIDLPINQLFHYDQIL